MLGLKRDIGQKERLTTEVKSIQADFPRTWTSNDQYHTNSTGKKYLTTPMIESAFCMIIRDSTFRVFTSKSGLVTKFYEQPDFAKLHQSFL